MPFETASTGAPAPAGCCASGAAASLAEACTTTGDAAARFVRLEAAGRARIDLLVPTIHCPACIATLERGLAPLPGVLSARV
ncbi:MAG: heavy-metal-associated domain-containing protein, partial [Pseudomonadota bacterium]